MATADDVASIALALPGVTEGTSYGNRSWSVGKNRFAWQRPLTKADVKRLGDEPVPAGEILAVTVADLGEKEAVLAANPDAFFTISHFADYPAVLIMLDVVTKAALVEAIEDGWLAVAPEKLIAERRT